jgi:hypothetical protein
MKEVESNGTCSKWKINIKLKSKKLHARDQLENLEEVVRIILKCMLQEYRVKV